MTRTGMRPSARLTPSMSSVLSGSGCSRMGEIRTRPAIEIDFAARNRIESRCGAGVVGDDPDFRRHAVKLFGQRAQIVGVQLRCSKSGERRRRLVIDGDVRNDRGNAVVEVVPASSDDEIVFAPADMSLAVEIDVAMAAGQQHDGVGRLIGLHQQDAHHRIGPGDPIVGDHRSRIDRPAVEQSS